MRAPTRLHADAVVGVTFLGERDPDDFSTYSLAFVAMFRSPKSLDFEGGYNTGFGNLLFVEISIADQCRT